MSGMQWFRFYNEALNDRKLVRIAQETQLPKLLVLGGWATLLVLANESPRRGCLMMSRREALNDDEIRREMDLDGDSYRALMAGFEARDMVHRDQDGCYVITNWEKRNFESDDATARSRRYRKQKEPMSTAGGAGWGWKDLESASTPAGDATLQELEDATLHERSVQRGCNGPDTDPETDTEADTEAESDPETDSESDHAYADAVASAEEIPRTFQAWHERVTTGKNPNAMLPEMLETLFPGRSPPSYQTIGRTAQPAGGAGRLADFLWQAAARPLIAEPGWE